MMVLYAGASQEPWQGSPAPQAALPGSKKLVWLLWISDYGAQDIPSSSTLFRDTCSQVHTESRGLRHLGRDPTQANIPQLILAAGGCPDVSISVRV